MQQIKKILEKIKSYPGCEVHKPSGVPEINASHFLPEDLYNFYQLCGGIILFKGKNYSIKISAPQDLVLANPVIVGQLCEYDISSSWYIIGSDFTSNQYITVDLSEERLGRCYDSFWDRHGVVGSCPIIATSFEELLLNLVKSRGESLYWLEPDFVFLGDAYQ